jgi:hypothetical protein
MRMVANETGVSDITLIEKSIRAFSLLESLRHTTIAALLPAKLNQLKKSNIEAFFHWNETGKLINLTKNYAKYLDNI